VWLAPQTVRELRRVVRYREQLVQEKRRLKSRIGGLLREHRLKGPDKTGRWSRRWLKWLVEEAALSEQSRWIVGRHLERLTSLRSEIQQVEMRLAQMTSDDATVVRLMTLKGIGRVTACMLRAEIGRFDRFNSGKQLSRFCGATPRNASSGERQADAGLVQACSRMLRTTVIEAAHRLMRWDERWKALAHRLRERGKKPCLVVAAVANRWLRWLYHYMQEPQKSF
jgi:transposase